MRNLGLFLLDALHQLLFSLKLLLTGDLHLAVEILDLGIFSLQKLLHRCDLQAHVLVLVFPLLFLSEEFVL